MARKAVYSSFVDALDYDEEAGVLTVEYQNGKSTQHEVDAETVARIWNAPSIGEALHANVPGFTARKKT
jgi:phage baseplate assembly protein gpV